MVCKKTGVMHRVKTAAIVLVMILVCSYALGGITPHIASVFADSGIEVSEGALKSYTVNDVVRIQPLSDTVVRIEQKGAKGFEDRNTYYVPDRSVFGGIESAHTSDENNFYIETDFYKVTVPKSADSLTGVTVSDKDGSAVYSYAGKTTPNTYLPSPSDELNVWYFSDSPRIVPSDKGYVSDTSDREFSGWDLENNAPDMYVFLPRGDYKRFCADYTRLTGPSEMVDLKMLGYWDSRWYAYSTETALQQIRDYQEKGYSIDMLVIDTDWRDASVGVGYDINTKLFPNMEEFLKQAHALGVNIVFNDHPEPRDNNGLALNYGEINYRSRNLKLILSMGLDYWWYDRNWHVALNKADPAGEISVFAFGMYAFQFITEEYYESITDIGEYARRGLIMGNVDGCLHGDWRYASDISAHRYSIQWTGDIGSDSVALAKEIRNAVFGGAENGLPYTSSDIGGHTMPVTDNMYSRWMQYGALSTICRVHCTSAAYIGQEGRMPWMFGDTAEAVTKEYVGMRYRLLPLYYALSAENYATGLPVLRRLDIEYPQYTEAARNDEYLLGDGIIVAPIDTAGENKSAPAAMFSHSDGNSTVQGLKGEYYNNTNHGGSPAFTKSDTDFIMDWKSGGPSGLGSDNFSVKWSGNFTVGNTDTRLDFYADDSVQVWVDGQIAVDSFAEGDDVYDVLLSTPYYPANSTHTIEIKYIEVGGQAHFYMTASNRPIKGESVCYNTRTVFVPDGVWTDVWTGKEYVGPKTYSVTHGLETSPIFVKKGTVNVLVENMTNTAEKDWSNVTLDVYPTLGGDRASVRLYEDDTETVAYKDGEFRTTDISMQYDTAKGALKIEIGAAEGEFSGKRAFDTRKWNVRVHAYPELGEVTEITVDGKKKSMRYYVRSSSASPFAFTGSALDSDIFEATFSGKVNEKKVIEIKFAHSEAFAAQTPRATDYLDTEAEFEVTLEDGGSLVDFDNAETLDWAFFGADASGEARKANVTGRAIGVLSSGFLSSAVSDSPVLGSWTNAEGVTSGKYNSGAFASEVDLLLDFYVPANTDRNYYVYLSGDKCIAKLSVRDRAGNVRTVTFGNLDGKFSYRAHITAQAEEDTELHLTYMTYSVRHDGTGTKSRVAVSAVAVTESNKPLAAAQSPFAAVKMSAYGDRTINAVESINISAADTAFGTDGNVLDWFKSGNVDGKDFIYKANADAIVSVNYSSYQGFHDYAGSMSWNDGGEVASNKGTREGLCTSGAGSISVTVNVDAKTKYIRLYTGCWNSTDNIAVYDMHGNLIASSNAFSAGGSSVCKEVTFTVNAQGASRVRIVISSSNEHDGGNVSLSAVTVLGNI